MLAVEQARMQLDQLGMKGAAAVLEWSCPGSVERLRLGDGAAQCGEYTSFHGGHGAWICGRPWLFEADRPTYWPPTYPHPLLLRRRLLGHATCSVIPCRSKAAGER